ncbi:hypothetical protein HPB48_020819 [Haemaphysalis longicornis]|uniref:RNase H type-1 domain-containing protein n=1 Tax=Haemaphysalis longicornis TaxID=44386 RepID=A0A9J6H0D0_HAELO|nr:hypothetical protein HPB48_020819 [Haemaphysalis longicornis]
MTRGELIRNAVGWKTKRELARNRNCDGPAHTRATTVVTDSQQACRHFQAGTVHTAARAMLLHHPPQRQIQIIWIQAHLGVKGNKTAHDLAREMTCRTRSEENAASERFTPLLTYTEITQHLRPARRALSPSHQHLSIEQAHHYHRRVTSWEGPWSERRTAGTPKTEPFTSRFAAPSRSPVVCAKGSENRSGE